MRPAISKTLNMYGNMCIHSVSREIDDELLISSERFFLIAWDDLLLTNQVISEEHHMFSE